LILVVLAATAGLMHAQPPFQTREPPLADDVAVEQVKGQIDPDAPEIKRADHDTPRTIPRALPSDLVGSGDVVPAAYTQVVGPAGELPTPAVTLNIEGSDVAPSGQTVVYKLVVRN